MADWDDRLERAGRILDQVTRIDPAEIPVWMADQVGAAIRDTDLVADRFGQIIPFADPSHQWHYRSAILPGADQRAHILASLLGVTRTCPHLRRGGPQAAYALLAIRLAECHRCAGTRHRPPLDEDDRCDYCGRRGVTLFTPIALSYGLVFLIGDACGDCADVLLPNARES